MDVEVPLSLIFVLQSCKKSHLLMVLNKCEVLKNEEFMSANSSFSFRAPPPAMCDLSQSLGIVKSMDRNVLSH